MFRIHRPYKLEVEQEQAPGDDACCRSASNGLFCTLAAGHEGIHKAGVSNGVPWPYAAEWDNDRTTDWQAPV